MLLKTRLPTCLLVGASILSVLTSHVFRNPNHSVSKRNSPHEVFTSTGHRTNTSAPKLAIHFGLKSSVHDSLLNVLSVNNSHSKRDVWTDAVAHGRVLYHIIEGRKTLPSPFQHIDWLTGVYPKGSHNSVGWKLVGQHGSPLSSPDELPASHGDQGALSSSDNPHAGSPQGASEGVTSPKPGDLSSLPSSDGDASSEMSLPSNQTPEEYEEVFKSLDIPLGEDNQNLVAYQGLDFTNCYGSGKQATEASFDNFYNVPGRTIVGNNNVSPAHKVKQIYAGAHRPLPPDWEKFLPFVSRYSDVIWLVWAELSKKAGKSPGNLKYIFKHHVITLATETIMDRAVNSHQLAWPGTKFTPNDDQYMALLGTAHGKGIFNLVTQHPADLGSKKIESISVFYTFPPFAHAWAHLLFTLTD